MKDVDFTMTGSKIIGGTLVEGGKYGFQAAIYDGFNERDDFMCGGSLIAPNVVLTSDSCIKLAKFVVFGCETLANIRRCERIYISEKRSFADLHVPSNFISSIGPSFPDTFFFETLINEVDLGILILREDSIQQPVAIAPPRFSLKKGEEMTISGWGPTVPLAYHHEDIIGRLRETTVELIDHEACNKQIASVAALSGIISPFSSDPPEIIKDLRICAAGDGTDTCGSDRGGPLLLSCPFAEEDLLIGVSSFGFGCAVDGIPRIYAALNIDVVFDFIRDIVEEQGHHLRVNLDVTSSDSFCNRNSSLAPDETPTPFPTFKAELWTCNPQSFGDWRECNCNCGLPDPDCEFIEPDEPCESKSLPVLDITSGTFIILAIIILLVIGLFTYFSSPTNKAAERQSYHSQSVEVEDPIPVAHSVSSNELVDVAEEIPVAQLMTENDSI